jgi:AraC family transcriptional regulator
MSLKAFDEIADERGVPVLLHPNERPFRCACAVMDIACYANRLESDECNDEPKDVVEILVLSGDPLFYALYRSAENPAAVARKAVVSDAKAEMIVIALDRVYFECVGACGGGVPRIPENYAAADSFLREIGTALIRDLRARLTPTRAYLEALASVIAIHLATHHCGRHAAPSPCLGLSRHKLERVLTYIKDHIAEPIQIRELARIVHVSLHHFARVFKQAVGMPPHAYVTTQRIEYAKALLSRTEFPLVEVAARAGFQTQSHFTAVFQRHLGVTPRRFRLYSRTPPPQFPTPITPARPVETSIPGDPDRHSRLHA